MFCPLSSLGQTKQAIHARTALNWSKLYSYGYANSISNTHKTKQIFWNDFKRRLDSYSSNKYHIKFKMFLYTPCKLNWLLTFLKMNRAISNVKALSHIPTLNEMSSFILKVISMQTHTNLFLHSPPWPLPVVPPSHKMKWGIRERLLPRSYPKPLLDLLLLFLVIEPELNMELDQQTDYF